MVLESLKHGDSCFVTLTYDEEHLPPRGSLEPKDVQLFLKRLRKMVSPEKIRFFCAGEYGETGNRPHYHLAIFGLDPISAGGFDGRGGACEVAWGNGFSYVGELNQDSAQYICGYVTKKINRYLSRDARKKQIERWRNGEDVYPEFARMSLRPGIGAGAVEDISRVLADDVGLDSILEKGDVPHSLLRELRGFPLGRYLRGKLREHLGFSSSKVPVETQKKYEAEMRGMFEEALRDPKVKAQWDRDKENGVRIQERLSKILVDMDAQKLRNQIARFEIYSSRQKL